MVTKEHTWHGCAMVDHFFMAYGRNLSNGVVENKHDYGV